jgi:hypothetical protein
MSKIYHYTKLSTAIVYILPTMTLRTNFLNKMNGPKESQRWAFGGINIDYERMYPTTYSDETHIDHQYKLGEEIKSRIQALCFVHSDEYPGFENEMMWAQYSDNHSGICLELDYDAFINENKDIDFFKFENITYKIGEKVSLYWNRNDSKENNIEKIINNHCKSLFLTKSHYWEKEFEKRLLIKHNGYCNLSIKNSLTGVYYGLTTNYNYDVAIEQFINTKKTKIYRVYFEDNQLKRMEKKLKE